MDEFLVCLAYVISFNFSSSLQMCYNSRHQNHYAKLPMIGTRCRKYHACAGRGSPVKKEWMRESASLGLLRGTKWPAPLTVTNVSPSYSTILPPTCILLPKYHQNKISFFSLKWIKNTLLVCNWNHSMQINVMAHA